VRQLRLTIKTRLILAALYEARDRQLYGYEITKLTGIPAAQVYPVLERLSKAGAIQREWEQPGSGRPPRRYIALNPSHYDMAIKASEGIARWGDLVNGAAA